MFEIFREGGHWCARRTDGLVCGLFRDRAEAERFARLEDEASQPMSAPGQGKSHPSPRNNALADPGPNMIAPAR